MKLSVKSVSIYPQDCEKKEESASFPLETQHFDEEGRLMEEYIYAGEALDIRKEFVYDSLGNKVSIKHYNAQDELRKVEQYDAKGYPTLTLLYDTQSREWLKYRSDATYDDDGYILSMQSYDHKEQPATKAFYVYSAPGVLKEQQVVHHKPGREGVFLQHFFYNAQGDIERTIHAALDTTVILTKHSYNREGSRTASQSRDEEGRLQEEKAFSYDPASQRLQRFTHITFDAKADTLSKTVERYNPREKRTEFIYYLSSYEEGNTPSVYEKYVYQVQGLLTSKETYKENRAHTCEKYVYTFY